MQYIGQHFPRYQVLSVHFIRPKKLEPETLDQRPVYNQDSVNSALQLASGTHIHVVEW